ncbi:hypothetical protein BDV93DRAFT_529809 [Ceratobasidium sp. AG-I]|nr:hypothetical protein BDV93DRAFT_529809 [Ceratobasidium sp. AG-I]
MTIEKSTPVAGSSKGPVISSPIFRQGQSKIEWYTYTLTRSLIDSGSKKKKDNEKKVSFY